MKSTGRQVQHGWDSLWTRLVRPSPAGDDKITKMCLENFPIIDFHVHLKGGLTIDQACENSTKLGINYGIAPNCGLKFPSFSKSSLIFYTTLQDKASMFKYYSDLKEKKTKVDFTRAQYQLLLYLEWGQVATLVLYFFVRNILECKDMRMRRRHSVLASRAALSSCAFACPTFFLAFG